MTTDPKLNRSCNKNSNTTHTYTPTGIVVSQYQCFNQCILYILYTSDYVCMTFPFHFVFSHFFFLMVPHAAFWKWQRFQRSGLCCKAFDSSCVIQKESAPAYLQFVLIQCQMIFPFEQSMKVACLMEHREKCYNSSTVVFSWLVLFFCVPACCDKIAPCTLSWLHYPLPVVKIRRPTFMN